MLNSFLKYLLYEKRYSQHTLISYETDLNQFNKFCVEEFGLSEPEKVEHRHLRTWIVQLMNAGISPKTINRKIASLRAFYKFLLKRETIASDPTIKLQVLKTPKQLPNFVQEKEIDFLFEQISFDESFEGYRDKLLLELLYGTGIRLSELINLKHNAVNDFNQNIKVLGKRNKERVIPISDSVRCSIKDYMMVKKDFFPSNDEDYLLVSIKGDKLYPMLVYRTVRKYLDAITTIEKRSPHVLRHTFATHLLNKGADLNAVKDLLGHSSLAATQVYTHNSLDKLKSVFDQAHPKA